MSLYASLGIDAVTIRLPFRENARPTIGSAATMVHPNLVPLLVFHSSIVLLRDPDATSFPLGE